MTAAPAHAHARGNGAWAPAGLAGGIIAAGEGRRLRAEGFTVPKPLVPVAGIPLLETVLGNFAAAGIAPVTIIVNERDAACADWVRARFPAAALRFIVKTTASSLESFLEVTAAGGGGPLLVSTVDAWCRPADFRAFVDAALRRGPRTTVLAVTPLVADEAPLWVSVARDGRVVRLGGQASDRVTAGIYLIPEHLRRRRPPAGLARLREYLAWLVAAGEPVYAEPIETVVDVDRAADVALAETLAEGRA